MKKYYEDAQAIIYHGDAWEIFPAMTVPISVVITDPPYGETRRKWDKWPDCWPTLMLRAPSFWCWGSMRMFWDHHAEFATFRLAQEIIWEKQNGTSMHNDRFRRVHEMACHFYPQDRAWSDIHHDAQKEPTGARQVIKRSNKPKHWGQVGGGTYDSTERLIRSVMRAKNGHRGGTDTTQKPLSVLRHLVAYSCPPGGLVVDIFCGSGSTLLAAREVGRRAVGIDINEAECEKAAKRLSQAHLSI